MLKVFSISVRNNEESFQSKNDLSLQALLLDISPTAARGDKNPHGINVQPVAHV
jgi:hypothetical protein